MLAAIKVLGRLEKVAHDAIELRLIGLFPVTVKVIPLPQLWALRLNRRQGDIGRCGALNEQRPIAEPLRNGNAVLRFMQADGCVARKTFGATAKLLDLSG
ncbi:hypothetical protein BP354E_5810 [Burkholderia pseudomallei 354e]|nr:hypothetical protein BP354E_5810 [Burkholderia pseudomallei 354e]EIF72603.1 hypothetical protein BP354A_6021 [Burkholderia pseudomallei 354a]CAJ3034992.1 Uncharacterised protein [Burkholderia pseudomallei]CAJ3105984.1 Uncharacterised protein [Burkholderia pseudomallei]CAJ3567329.1 Uncharacterised protein [Burkholderia pseudomallei]